MNIFRNLFKKTLTDNKHKIYWRALATTLAGVVVFVTTYSLILPAITMDSEVAENMPGFSLEEDVESYEIVPDPDTDWEDELGTSEDLSFDESSENTSSDQELDGDTIFEEDQSKDDGNSYVSGSQEGIPTYTVRELTQIIEDTSADNKVRVHLTFEEDAFIPDGTQLYAYEITEVDNEYSSYITAAEDAIRTYDNSWSDISIRMYALKLLYGEETVIPENKVNVNLQFTPHITSDKCKVLCFEDSDSEQNNDESSTPSVLEGEFYEYAEDGSIEQITFDSDALGVIGIAEGEIDDTNIGAEDISAQNADNAHDVADAPCTKNVAISEVETETEEETEAVIEAEVREETETEIKEEAETRTEKGAEAVIETEIEEDTEIEAETETETEEESLPAQEFYDSTETMQVQVVAAKGAFPEGTTMVVKDVVDEMTLSAIEDAAIEDVSNSVESRKTKVSSVHAVDITFLDIDGNEIEPRQPIRVFMTPTEIPEEKKDNPVIVHVDNEGNAETIETLQEENLPANSLTEQTPELKKVKDVMNTDSLDSDVSNISIDTETVVFEADAFSVYALVYTVDFSYSVNGKMFEFCLPGGGFVSFKDLVEVLDIFGDTNNEDNKAENDTDINEFVADVESVEFSSPSLVDISKVDVETTVGQIKKARGLECEYSSDLTEEQIEEINAQTVEAGNWALISVHPFESEEDLTITMKNGEVFTIHVTDAQIKQSVIDAKGDEWEISVTYDTNAQIPVGAELKVEEILPEDGRYEDYCKKSVEKTSEESGVGPESADPKVDYAHIFDIEIWADGHKTEPAANVSVNIRLSDAPEKEGSDLKIVHFSADGPEVMETEENPIKDGKTELSFVTDEFSVYAVINEADHGQPDLGERMVKIGVGGYYLTNQTNYGETPWKITKTNDINQAAWYQFEETASSGVYRVYTMVNGQKNYMHINHHNQNPTDPEWSAGVNLTGPEYTMDLNVVQNADGTYGIYRNDGGTDYYLNHYDGANGSGFAAYADADGAGNSKLTFVSSDSGALDGGAYIVLAKIDEYYYIVNNDGSLTSVEYDETTNRVKVENPMMWTFTGSNLYHNSDAVDLDGARVASDFYYKYIDPSTESGISLDDSSNTEREIAGYKDEDGDGTDDTPYYRIVNGTRQMQSQSALTYINKHLVSKNGDYYIGVKEEDGVLKLVGTQDRDHAVEILFASPTSVLPVDSGNHTVSHIDISIEGSAEIHVPLAYGKYYNEDREEILEVSTDKAITLHREGLGISTDDMKKATIVAYTKNAYGEAVPIDNAFYITGYSANAATEYSTPQVRIEGSFKVADLDPSDQDRQHRLDNKIYYSVTAIKTVTFDLIDPEAGQLYDADGNKLTITVDVAFSASFDYWDERNECPPVQWNIDSWREGEIPGGSGMDFVLGGDAEQADSNIVAAEITKLIVDESGHRIKIPSTTSIVNSFGMYQNKTGNPNSVIGLDINQYSIPADYEGYTRLHTKNVKVGPDGIGIVYDYDVTPGMFYIQEDKDSIPDTITDADGETWHYVGTRIETEYPWRNQEDYNENDMHVSDTYTKEGTADYNSIPEVLGPYTDIYGNGTHYNEQTQKQEQIRNGFLEFFVYNIYELEKTEVKVKKEWVNGDAPDGATVDVVLKRYKLVKEGGVTPPEPTTASLTISDSYSGLSGDRTFSASYHVTGPNNYDQTFNGTGEQFTIPDLPFGEYTVTKTASAQDGYDAENLNEVQTVTLDVTGAEVEFAGTTYTRQNTSSTFYHVLVYANDTTNQGTSHIVSNGHFAWVDADYQEGTELSFSVGVPSWNNNSNYSYSVNGGNAVSIPAGQTKTQQITVNQDIVIVVNGDTPYYGIDQDHPWGQWLNPTPSVSIVSVPNKGRTASFRKGPMRAASVYNLSNNGSNPDIEGYTWQEDTTWFDGEGLLVQLPDNGSWEKVVSDLEKVDAFGNVYVYYIDSVTENGMPSGMTAEITLDGENKLFVYGDHSTEEGAEHTNDTLKVKNILATETTVTIQKVIKGTSTPLPGAEFTIHKFSDPEHRNEITTDGYPIVRSVDANGTIILSDLWIGYYQLEESKTPAGYVKVSEDPYFEVKRNTATGEIEVGFENTQMVTYASGTFTVENERGAALPSTGGPGTRLFTILGSILAAGAGLLLWRRRRLIL